MRRIGQHLPLLTQQQLQPFGGLVERRGQRGHLVPAGDGHAQAKLPAAPALDPACQFFEPSGHAPGDRVTAHRHDEGQRDQRREEGMHPQPAIRTARTQRHPTVAAKGRHQHGSGPTTAPAWLDAWRDRKRVGRRHAQEGSTRVAHDDIDTEFIRQPQEARARVRSMHVRQTFGQDRGHVLRAFTRRPR